jgi:hypothetical protein
MMTGWRARLHYWSRQRGVLQKASVSIVLGAFLLSWLIVQTQPSERTSVMVDPIEQTIRNDWQRLRNATEPQPRAFTHWLRKLMPSLKLLAASLEVPAADWVTYSQTGKVLAYEVEFPLRFHLTNIPARKLAEDYLEAYLSGQDSVGKAAAARVSEQAALEKPPPYANEFHASLLLRTDHDADALAAFIREGSLFQNTDSVRETALRLALNLKEADSLRAMQQLGWLSAAPPLVEHDTHRSGRWTLVHSFGSAFSRTALALGMAYRSPRGGHRQHLAHGQHDRLAGADHGHRW